jgi:hypothetical protein
MEMYNLHMYLVEDLNFKIIISLVLFSSNNLHAPRRINVVTNKSNVKTKETNGPKLSTNTALAEI